eukprot:Hpha_TRINITY_DN15687_c4_g2::TRINITY_DN15687_c4_g2_i1::g.99098::m.99098/K19476/IST1; vacuolar protein sorting-associated protein IST1
MGLFSRPKFDKVKLKAALGMAKQRANIHQQGKRGMIMRNQAELRQLMEQGKYESARVRVEAVVREDKFCDGLETLGLFCDLLSQRSSLIAEARSCPPELVEAVATLLWAEPRAGVDELSKVREQLELKFGPEWVQKVRSNGEAMCNKRVYENLSCQVPPPHLCLAKLEAIAKSGSVDWEEARQKLENSSLIPCGPGVPGGRAPAGAAPAATPPGRAVPPGPPPAGAARPPPMEDAQDDLDRMLAAAKRAQPGAPPPAGPVQGAAQVSNPYGAPQQPAAPAQPPAAAPPAAAPRPEQQPLPPPQQEHPPQPQPPPHEHPAQREPPPPAWKQPAPMPPQPEAPTASAPAPALVPPPFPAHVDPGAAPSAEEEGEDCLDLPAIPTAPPGGGMDDLQARLLALGRPESPGGPPGPPPAEELDAKDIALRLAKVNRELQHGGNAPGAASVHNPYGAPQQPAEEPGAETDRTEPQPSEVAPSQPRDAAPKHVEETLAPVPQKGKQSAPLPDDPEPEPSGPPPPVGATVNVVAAVGGLEPYNGLQGTVVSHRETAEGAPGCLVDLGQNGRHVFRPSDVEVEEGCA